MGYRPFGANLPAHPDSSGLHPGLTDVAPSGLCFQSIRITLDKYPELADVALSGLYSLPDMRFTRLRHALWDIAPSGLCSLPDLRFTGLRPALGDFALSGLALLPDEGLESEQSTPYKTERLYRIAAQPSTIPSSINLPEYLHLAGGVAGGSFYLQQV